MTISNSSKPPLSQRLKELMLEYGSLAIWTYLAIFGLVLVAFALAIQLGLHSSTTAGKAGVWGAAYLATKLTQPLRIAATLAVTPVVMRVVRRSKRVTKSS